jgi:hypothetical protein
MTELVLEGFGALELSGETQVPITYDINDIRILGNRNGAWSKTIKVPGTNRNNEILGNVFSINLSTFDFDPLKKVDVRQVVDGQVVFRGIFQLRKINRKYTSPTEYKIEYDCTVKNDASGLFADLSGKRMSDLDLSQYDHFFAQPLVVENLENGNFLSGYQYFLGYNGFETDYFGKNLIPAVYARTYLDKIMQEAGYLYEFPEIEELNFNNLIIPFNGEYYSPAIDRKFLFRAGSSQVNDYPMMKHIGNGVTFNNNFTFYPETPLRYDDDNNPPNNWLDNESRYDEVLYRYDVTGFEGTMDFTIKLRGQIGIIPNMAAPGVPSQVNLVGSINIRPNIKFRVKNAAGVVLLTLYDKDILPLDERLFDDASCGTLDSEVFNPVRDIDINETAVYASQLVPNAAYVEVTFSTFVTFPGLFIGVNTGGLPATTNFVLRQFASESSQDNIIQNSPSSEISEGTRILMNTVIPKDYKQSEFLLDLAKMFNLYIYQDPVNDKRVIMKTRDHFYEGGDTIDWSDKIDMSTVDIDFLSNSQKKIKRLTYSQDDKDVLLTAYQDQTRETYSQLRYVFENEFIRETDDMETVFSPTPTIFANGLYLPYIDSQKPNNNIRILQIGNLIKGSWQYAKFDVTPTSFGTITKVTTPYAFYRHAGMVWPTPLDPTLDISFGTPQYFAYPIEVMTNANLYNRFYRNQLQILERGKMLRAKFRLTVADILTLKFNEKIWLLESWWNINRIIDWDANKPGLTQVELVSAESGLPDFIPGQFTIESSSASRYYGKAAEQPYGKNEYGPGTSNTRIFGKDNLVHPNSGNLIVIGDGNNISGREQIVLGTSNQVSGERVAVLGVKGQQFDESDRVYMTTPVIISPFISAGRDEVLSAFPDAKVVNLVSGSRDEVRELGTYSIENQIFAGKDRV